MIGNLEVARRADALLIDHYSVGLVGGLIRDGVLDDLMLVPDRPNGGEDSVIAGRVTKIDDEMNAAFVDIGTAGNALLRARDLEREMRTDRPISRALHLGQMLAVKLVHEGYDDKGPRVIGRVDPKLRNAAIGRHAGALLRQSDPMSRIVSTFLPAKPVEIVVADTVSRLAAENALPGEQNLPVYVDPDSRPFARFDAIGDIASATEAEVALPGGGRLTFDQARALLAVDVDGGAGARDLARLNRSAAGAIARQLRIRNSSGVIIIDFINGSDAGRQPDLDAAMRSATQPDRNGCRLAGFGPLGLFEMSRNRRGTALSPAWLDSRGTVV